MKKRNPELIKQVRTRVAPSPTGMPHVGTALQALLNLVYARRYEGKYCLRIEDTDQKRFDAASEKGIFEALAWLDLNPDESIMHGGDYGPYRQSERLKLYKQYAEQLVKEGKAYYCFCTPERLNQMRLSQQKKKLPPKYDRHCLGLSQKEITQKIKNGEKAVIRLKVPENKTIIVKDALRGNVSFDSNTIDDQVLLKSDGFPTYHLAVVVDDHLMKITHLLRGEEWLPSAPKHMILYDYFSWTAPVMIHTPTLRNRDRSKLSKRKGHTSIWYYREMGYLPAALLNFLALLVWKPQDQREIYSRLDMINDFEWEQIKVTGPIFDLDKLTWMNGLYLRKMDLPILMSEIKSWASWVKDQGQDEVLKAQVKDLLAWINHDQAYFENALKLCQDRLKLLSELPDLMQIYYQDTLIYDRDDLLQKQSQEKVLKMLLKLKENFSERDLGEMKDWEMAIRSLADQFTLAHKDVFMILRSALTARKQTPPLYEVMKVIGKDEYLKRLDLAINFVKSL